MLKILGAYLLKLCCHGEKRKIFEGISSGFPRVQSRIRRGHAFLLESDVSNNYLVKYRMQSHGNRRKMQRVNDDECEKVRKNTPLKAALSLYKTKKFQQNILERQSFDVHTSGLTS